VESARERLFNNGEQVSDTESSPLAVVWFLLTPLFYIWRGFALVKLWAWFIVPAFAAPAIGIPTAIGISLIVAFMTATNTKAKTDDEYWIRAMVNGVAWPGLALIVGAIVKAFA
jgi:hypothetical protein